jgi:hypothetical protein
VRWFHNRVYDRLYRGAELDPRRSDQHARPAGRALAGGAHRGGRRRTLNTVRGIIPMYELSLDGLQAAVEGLMVRRAR